MDYFELSNGAKIPCLGTGPSAVYRRMNDINYKWKWISDIPLIGRLLYRISSKGRKSAVNGSMFCLRV